MHDFGKDGPRQVPRKGRRRSGVLSARRAHLAADEFRSDTEPADVEARPPSDAREQPADRQLLGVDPDSTPIRSRKSRGLD